MTEIGFGIDIGGSGIKGAPVDLVAGKLATKRVRIPTPQPSTPQAVAETVKDVVSEFFGSQCPSSLGITMPCVVHDGVTRSAANIDPAWVNHRARDTFSETLGTEVVVLNDADAAALAELHYGAAQNHQGLIILTTLGTGIGSAMIYNGVLIPNAELGHIEIDSRHGEDWAAARVRVEESLSWPDYAQRLQRYYSTLEFLFSPDLFIVGGGVSKDADQFLPLLTLETPILPALLRNQAGIIGAAWQGRESLAARS
ncbi:MAG: ROK family protein [Propionibacteriaceae bacterium]|nr:ROK family protein [Propionibacteriaceae bacterium]